jgi:hypothetical protein
MSDHFSPRRRRTYLRPRARCASLTALALALTVPSVAVAGGFTTATPKPISPGTPFERSSPRLPTGRWGGFAEDNNGPVQFTIDAGRRTVEDFRLNGATLFGSRPLERDGDAFSVRADQGDTGVRGEFTSDADQVTGTITEVRAGRTVRFGWSAQRLATRQVQPPKPRSGNWAGPTDDNRAVRFEINDSRTTVRDFRVGGVFLFHAKLIDGDDDGWGFRSNDFGTTVRGHFNRDGDRATGTFTQRSGQEPVTWSARFISR